MATGDYSQCLLHRLLLAWVMLLWWEILEECCLEVLSVQCADTKGRLSSDKTNPSSADAASDQVCGHCIAVKYLSNLKQHILSSILKYWSWKAAKKANEEAKNKKCAQLLKAAKLTQSLSNGTMYKKDSDQHKLLTRKLAVFVGSSNIANRIVESLDFWDLLHCLDHRCQVPGRAAVKKKSRWWWTQG